MLHNIVKTSAVCERMIGHVYHLLAGFTKPGSVEEETLRKMATEEKEHANALLEALEHLPEHLVGYDYSAIVDYQTDFMARLVLIQEELEGDFDWLEVLAALEELEGSLADNLMVHLKPALDDDGKRAAERLSEETTGHGKQLRALIEARR